MKNTLVIKFGGASVASAEGFNHAAQIVEAKMACHGKIAVVVSAMKGTTDELIALAQKVHNDPPKREYDMLVSVGERISISLLAMAFNKLGLKAKSFTGSQSGIITSYHHSEAQIINVKPHRIKKALDEGFIAIVAGFQGVSEQGEITTLGRGGSDTTAVALAIALNEGSRDFSEVEFYKDVEGIFSEDPMLNHSGLKKFDYISYQEALEIAAKGAKVLHPRAIKLAKDRVRLRVRSFKNLTDPGTLVVSTVMNKPMPIYYEEPVDSLQSSVL